MMERNDLQSLNKYRSQIMGVAALWILIFHEWQIVTEGCWGLYVAEKAIKRIGFCGVDFFFFLSGIGMTYAIAKYRVTTFYKRRIVNVFLPFLVTAIVMAFVQHWSFSDFLKNTFFFNFYMDSIYSFLWFVPAIFTFYLLFPLYYKVFARTQSKVQFTVCLLLIWVLVSVALRDIMRPDLYGFTNRIPVFVVGILAGWILQNKNVIFTKLTWKICICAFLLGLYFAYLTNYEDYFLVVPTSNCCIPNFLMAISGSCLLGWLFLRADTHLKMFGQGILKVFGFLGSISLELYCVEEWLGNRLRTILDLNSKLLINVIVFACIICSACLLHVICKLIRRIFTK
ncbi:MAG: acyltransferase [Lachnospiraceae bacterium]|nr:acyltransferase [Lachnospiraceae bacterium]